jgi:hypothetical protein
MITVKKCGSTDLVAIYVQPRAKPVLWLQEVKSPLRNVRVDMDDRLFWPLSSYL